MSTQESRKSLYKSVGKLKIYAVDSEWVTNTVCKDFSKSGHDLEYDFIPEFEIWVDGKLNSKEFMLCVVSKFYERLLLASGWEKNMARENTGIVENKCRGDSEFLDMFNNNWVYKC